MRWDTKRRQYVDSKGRIIPPAEIRKQIDDYIKIEQADAQAEAEKLLAGEITVASFFAFMREKIAMWHEHTGAVSYGGLSQMDDQRWARIQAKIDSEIQYLNDFEVEVGASHAAAEKIAQEIAQSSAIPAGLDSEVEQAVRDALLTAAPSEAESVARQAVEDALEGEVDDVASVSAGAAIGSGILTAATVLIGGSVIGRIGQYPNAAYSTYANNERERERDEGIERARRTSEEDGASCDECVGAATSEFIPIDEVPDIGSLQCLNNCRCIIEYDLGRQDVALEGGVVTQEFVQ